MLITFTQERLDSFIVAIFAAFWRRYWVIIA